MTDRRASDGLGRRLGRHAGRWMDDDGDGWFEGGTYVVSNDFD